MCMLLGVFIHFLPGEELMGGSLLERGIDQMESKYYPMAYLLVIVSSIARQTMNVSAVGERFVCQVDELLRADLRPAVRRELHVFV